MIQPLITFFVTLIVFTGVIEISRRIFMINEKSEYFDVWDGTIGQLPQLDDDGWYVINTCSELAAFAKAVNDAAAPVGANYKYRLAANLDLNNIEWTPIGMGGNNSAFFTNIFDGAGHIIKNLKCSNSSMAGLFGIAMNMDYYGAVRISGITVHGEVGPSSIAGGITAYSGIYQIENCVNYCTVIGTAACGGIVGSISASPMEPSGQTLIRNCINFGHIIAGDLYEDSIGAGGILGGVMRQDAGLIFAVASCTNYGTIEIQPPLNSIAGVGGIVGGRVSLYSSQMITGCANAGELLPTNLAAGFANPISFTGPNVMQSYYWKGPESGTGTKVNSASESVVTSLGLSSDLFIPTAEEKVKFNIYPPESHTTQYTPGVKIMVTHPNGSVTNSTVPWNRQITFDASSLRANTNSTATYENYVNATSPSTQTIANMFYKRYTTDSSPLPILPIFDNNYDVWNGSIDENIQQDSSGYYVIDSAAKLAGLAVKVNRGDYSSIRATFRLATNIDLNNIPWTPIGRSGNKSFSNNFNGAGYIIKNLYCVDNSKYIGLFGILPVGEVIIKNVTVYGTVIGGNTTLGAGGIVGYFDGNCRVYNCINYCTVKCRGAAGGIVGTGAVHSGSDPHVINCINFGEIIHTSPILTGDDVYSTGAAGIFGVLQGGVGDNRVENNINYGTVHSDTVITNNDRFSLGGIVKSTADLSYNLNIGDVYNGNVNNHTNCYPVGYVSEWWQYKKNYFTNSFATSQSAEDIKLNSISESPVISIQASPMILKSKPNQIIRVSMYPQESSKLKTNSKAAFSPIGIDLYNNYTQLFDGTGRSSGTITYSGNTEGFNPSIGVSFVAQ